jgi:hypothetical protein
LIQLSQKLDAAYRDVTVAARPLGSSWSVVTKPGHVRQTLAIFLSGTYWSRVLASGYEPGAMDEKAQQSIVGDMGRLEDVAARGADCFFIERKTAGAASRHLPLSREGSRLGIEMIGSTLERLYPQR